MFKAVERQENGYLARNKWISPLIIALALFGSQQIMNYMGFISHFTNILLYIAVFILVVYAGILNALSGTKNAKVFRWLIVAGLIANTIWIIVRYIK